MLVSEEPRSRSFVGRGRGVDGDLWFSDLAQLERRVPRAGTETLDSAWTFGDGVWFRWLSAADEDGRRLRLGRGVVDVVDRVVQDGVTAVANEVSLVWLEVGGGHCSGEGACVGDGHVCVEGWRWLCLTPLSALDDYSKLRCWFGSFES
jgi:hypothetical protein